MSDCACLKWDDHPWVCTAQTKDDWLYKIRKCKDDFGLQDVYQLWVHGPIRDSDVLEPYETRELCIGNKHASLREAKAAAQYVDKRRRQEPGKCVRGWTKDPVLSEED